MLARGALLLALAIVVQQLRLILPLPTLITTLLIGTIVNATLALAARFAGLFTAVVMCLALPIIAFLQGHLPLVFLIPIVFIGNFILVVLCNKFWRKPIFIIAPIAKASVMYLGAVLLFKSFAINAPLAKVILVTMSWPQLVTAFLGILLARFLEKRLTL
jgi:hypothetical protein